MVVKLVLVTLQFLVNVVSDRLDGLGDSFEAFSHLGAKICDLSLETTLHLLDLASKEGLGLADAAIYELLEIGELIVIHCYKQL